MSDPMSPLPPPARQLGYHAEQEYRPTSALQPKAAAVALSLGLVAAAVIAGILVAWQAMEMPTIIGLAGVAQGTLLGLAARWVFRRARLHSWPAAVVILVLLALSCTFLTYAGLYVRHVYSVRDAVRRQVAGEASRSGVPATVMNVTERPFAFYDHFFVGPETGHTGFIGFLLSKQVMNLGKQPTHVLTFVLVNGLALLIVAYRLGRSQALEPFCEQCGAWFGPPSNAAVLPGFRYGELAGAIESADPAAAGALIRQAAGEDVSAGGCAVAQFRKCPGCGQTFADVVLKYAGRSDSPRTRPVRVSAEMVQALRAEPVMSVAAGEAGDAAESSEGGSVR